MKDEAAEERTAKRGHRTEHLVAHEAANFILAEAGNESLITVTRAILLERGSKVIVYITVFPQEHESAAQNFLRRQREAFSDYLKTHTRLTPLPRVEFEIDRGEEYRRYLDQLSRGPGGN